MNSALVRRLKREAKANPAKAGALALTIVIALWFWAPLVIHWCSPATAPVEEQPPTVAAAEPVAQPSNDAAGRSAPAGEKTPPTIPWQQLVQAIEHDPRMQPTRHLGEGRDPFGQSAAEIAAAKASEQKKTKRAPPPELLPADAGLVLNSTLVGSGRRMALIGGEPYWEGDTVPAPRDTASFQLVEIFARQVVLERQGKKYGLEIKSTNTSGHDSPVASDPRKPSTDNSLPTTRLRSSSQHSRKAAGAAPSAPFANVNPNQ